MSDAQNVICVGVPTRSSSSMHKDFWLSLFQLRWPHNVSKMITVVDGLPVDEARNKIVEHAKEGNAKYLLFIDDDVFPPPDGLQRLLARKADIVSGVYYTKSQPPYAVISKYDYPAGIDDWVYGDVLEVDFTGGGFLLIDMKVFDKLKKPYFRYNKGRPQKTEEEKRMGNIGEDVWFCKKAQEAGFKVIADTSIQCTHFDYAEDTGYYYNLDAGFAGWRKRGEKEFHYIPTAEVAVKAPKEREYKGGNVCWGYKEVPDGFEREKSLNANYLKRHYRNIENAWIKRAFEKVSPEKTLGVLMALNTCMKKGGNIKIEIDDGASIGDAISPDTKLSDIQDIMGNKPVMLYTEAMVRQLAKIAGFNDIRITSDESKIILECKGEGKNERAKVASGVDGPGGDDGRGGDGCEQSEDDSVRDE